MAIIGLKCYMWCPHRDLFSRLMFCSALLSTLSIIYFMGSSGRSFIYWVGWLTLVGQSKITLLMTSYDFFICDLDTPNNIYLMTTFTRHELLNRIISEILFSIGYSHVLFCHFYCQKRCRREPRPNSLFDLFIVYRSVRKEIEAHNISKRVVVLKIFNVFIAIYTNVACSFSRSIAYPNPTRYIGIKAWWYC